MTTTAGPKLDKPQTAQILTPDLIENATLAVSAHDHPNAALLKCVVAMAQAVTDVLTEYNGMSSAKVGYIRKALLDASGYADEA